MYCYYFVSTQSLQNPEVSRFGLTANSFDVNFSGSCLFHMLGNKSTVSVPKTYRNIS